MEGARVTLAAIVVTVLALFLLIASPVKGAVRSEFFGIAQGAPTDVGDVNGMAAAKVRTARFLLEWRKVQPRAGTFLWAPFDAIVGRLASRGIRPVPFVWGSPTWAGLPGPSRPPVDTSGQVQAWQTFLKAAVARYKPGGTYWTNPNLYQSDHPGKAAWPVTHWQIWNEANLQRYFNPGGTTGGGAQKYAKLVQVSRSAIKSRDLAARIVLAGLLGNGDTTAWDFLANCYNVAGFRNSFDVAAIHPYASYLDQFRKQILRFRGVMANRGDAGKPLWLTEFGWGSAPPDQYGINKGLAGQKQFLVNSFNTILDNRRAWNVQHIYWFLWRDPQPGSGFARLCSFCGSGGLLTYGRTAKPAYSAFRSFSAETTPPVASITGGPAQGGFTPDATPTFSFTSNEHGSTFVCRFDAQPWGSCFSPLTRGSPLTDGPHTFSVQAIDAPGNQSAVVTRSFTVDTQAPAAPQITGTDPNSPANNNAPKVQGSAEAASRVKLYTTAGCAGVPVAQGWAGAFASPGIAVSVADNTTTAFRATATDGAGNTSACSAARLYVEDSTP